MEIIFRIAIIYVAIMIGLRMLGKRDVGKLSPFDFVTLMMIPEIVSQALVGEDFSVTASFIGLATLFVLVFITSLLSYRSRTLGRLFEGTPTLLVQHGRLRDQDMDRERVSPDELFAEMHKSGMERLEQIKWAILENDGTITIIPVDPRDKQIKHRETEHGPVA